TIAVTALLASRDRECEIAAASMDAMNNVFEPLVACSNRPFQDTGSRVPEDRTGQCGRPPAPEEPRAADDGLAWPAGFREGVKSHSGNPLVAAGFAYAIERHQQVWSLGSFYNFVAGLLPRERTSWKVVDGRTLEVTTEKPSPLFKILLQNNFAF